MYPSLDSRIISMKNFLDMCSSHTHGEQKVSLFKSFSLGEPSPHYTPPKDVLRVRSSPTTCRSWKGFWRSPDMHCRRKQMGLNTSGVILVASIRPIVPGFPKASIRCINGIEINYTIVTWRTYLFKHFKSSKHDLSRTRRFTRG